MEHSTSDIIVPMNGSSASSSSSDIILSIPDDHYIIRSSSASSSFSDIIDDGFVMPEPFVYPEDNTPDQMDYINECLKTMSETEVAMLFKWYKGNEYFMHGTTSQLYKLGKVGWKIHVDSLLKYDMLQIDCLFLEYQKELEQAINNNTAGDGVAERKIVRSIDLFLQKLYSNGVFRTKCIKSYKDICRKIENIENNEYKFCFDNCIYDLENNIFVPVNCTDYSILSTGYEYQKPKQEDIASVNDIINAILPDKDIRQFVMEHISTGLCGRGVSTFLIARGVGGNGKTTLYNLAKTMFGNYALTVENDVLCRPLHYNYLFIALQLFVYCITINCTIICVLFLLFTSIFLNTGTLRSRRFFLAYSQDLNRSNGSSNVRRFLTRRSCVVLVLRLIVPIGA